jgi:GTP-binding protein Era
LIGFQGKMIKAIGTAARRELERELGCQVHLDLSVRVRRDWRADESSLDRLGIT